MRLKHPNKVPAHCTFILRNICLANNGKQPPITERKIVFAANTEAANWRYESMR